MSKEFKLGTIFSVVDKITGPVQKIQKAFIACEKTINAGKAMQDFGAKVGLTGAVITSAAHKMNEGIASMKAPYMEVEEALLALRTVTTSSLGAMDKSMELTKKKAIEWSKNHRESAEKYIQTTYQMASAGLNDVAAIEATEAAMRTARATMGDSTEAATLIAVAYNNMKREGISAKEEIGRFGDVIAKTQQLFQIKNLTQLSDGLKYAIPVALQFKQSFEEINTVVGFLNNAGYAGGQAGTLYQSSMAQMIKASKDLGFAIAQNDQGGTDFIGTLENIRAKYGDFAQMAPEVKLKFQQAFGQEGLKGISLLLNKTAEMREKMESLKKATGTAEASQKIMENSEAAKMEIAANRLQAIKIDFAERLLKSGTVVNQIIPKMSTIIESVADAAAGFMNANPELAAFLATALMAGAALLTLLGPIVAIAGGFVSMAGVMISCAGKIGQKILELALFIKDANFGEHFHNISKHASNTLGKTRDCFVRAGNAAKAFGSRVLDAGHNAWQGLMRVATMAKQMALTMLQAGKQAALSMLQAGKQAALSLAQNLSRAASAASVFAGRMLLAGRNATIAAASGLKQATIGLLQFARQAIITAATALPGLIAATWAWTAALLTNPVTWIVLAIVAAVALLIYYWDDLKAAGIAAWNYLSEAAGNAWNSFNEIIDGLIGSVVQFGETLWNTFAETFPGIAGFIDSMQSTFETSGAALWDAFCNGIRSVLSKPAELVQEGLQMIRNMLPFSDAKEGPLSQLTKSGRAVLATIAEGVPGSYGKLQAAVATGFEGINLAPDLPVKPNWSIESLVPGITTFPALPGWNPEWMNEPGPMPEKPEWRMEDPLELITPRREQPPRQAVQIQKEGRKIIIYGDIHIQTQQMNNANDFMEALRTIADSEGDGDAD